MTPKTVDRQACHRTPADPLCWPNLSGSGGEDADGAAHARGVVGAVAVRHLVQVLLVVVLGEVEVAGRYDLRRDRAVARLGELLAVRGRRLLSGLALRV